MRADSARALRSEKITVLQQFVNLQHYPSTLPRFPSPQRILGYEEGTVDKRQLALDKILPSPLAQVRPSGHSVATLMMIWYSKSQCAHSVP